MCILSDKSFGYNSREAIDSKPFSKPLDYSGRVIGGTETPSRFSSWYCVDCKGSGSSSVPGASASSGSGPCDTPSDYASNGSICGGRAASERVGGR